MFDSSPSEEISDSTFHINDLIFLFDVRSCLVYLNDLIILCDNVFGLVHNMYITIVNVLSKHLTMYNTYVMFYSMHMHVSLPSILHMLYRCWYMQ